MVDMVDKVYTEEEVKRSTLQYFSGDELATSVWISKYALRNKNDELLELNPNDTHRRIAKEFARIEKKYSNPMSEDEIFSLLEGFKYIIPQGSPMSGIGNQYKLQSLSNCFVIPQPQDSYGGIFLTDQQEAQIMKRRGGVGFDISKIRPKGVSTNNAAVTTDGIGVFMERYSNTCREVAQGGRRGALMLTIDVRHPEIETFINIKRDKKKVTGANISIRVTDDFMKAVTNNDEYLLRWPVDANVSDAQVTKLINAKDVWEQIVGSAWGSAEPGILFWDTAQKNTPSDIYASVGYQSVSTNPCIIGSTLIAVADGRNAVSIKQLAEEGNDVPVYSTNPETGQIEIKWGRNPRLTKSSVEVWKLILDDGSFLIATPDHKIMMKKDRSYVELKDLKPGDSIFAFRSFDSNGYRQICDIGIAMKGGARRNRRQYRAIYEFFEGAIDSKHYAIHHNDFNSKNDKINNLRKMTHEDHQKLHSELMLGKNNPYYRMSDDWKHSFASHPGENNGRFSGHSNDQLLEHGKKLFVKNGKITCKMWSEYAKQNNLPQFLNNKFRFGSWKNFANQVATNHKVVSVERYGIEDVYNITVDDNHNYHVITSGEDDQYIVSSGICVKNCGEIVLSPYDSCRLLVVNLANFVDDPFKKNSKFNFEKFDSIVQKAQRLMDDLVDLELESVDSIIKKINSDPEDDITKMIEKDLWQKIKKTGEDGRRTGLGVTALGDALAMLGIQYGSTDSIEMTEKIYRSLALAAYRSTVKMAQERGTFNVYDFSLEKDHEFINSIMDLDEELKSNWKKFGRRNIALTTTAPVGSVSTLTQTTSGIEPAFLLSYVRRKKINPNDKDAKVDFIDDMGDKWQHFTVYHHRFKQWMDITGKSKIEDSPYYLSTSNDVDWLASVKLQSAAQKWICHSISKTCNLPKNVSHDLISDVYVEAWKQGCKGFTVYRDKSRDGVLVSDAEVKYDLKSRFDGISKEEIEKHLSIGLKNIDKLPQGCIQYFNEVEAYLKADESSIEHVLASTITDRHAPKRPKELSCDIHRVNVKGESYLAFVGLLDNRPYELFCGLSDHIEVPKKIKKGTIVKNGKINGISTYNLRIPIGDDDEMTFKDIVTIFDNPTNGSFTRTISLALRHGVPVQYLVEQLRKDKHGDMTSFSNVIARVLSKNYISDGTQSASEKVCSSCGEAGLIYQEGCITCKSCGNSKCG